MAINNKSGSVYVEYVIILNLDLTTNKMPTYTFKLDLIKTSPLVTRTFKVSSESSFYLLHHIIQEVMGWKNYHLYEFKVDGNTIADKSIVEEDLSPISEAKEVMLEDIFTHIGKSVKYVYDFGDWWEHHLELIEISNAPQNEPLPIIVCGENACPPEDCMGVHGYAELKEILKDPENINHEDFWQNVGLSFNPLKFNKKAAEKELAKLTAKIRKYEG